ncbi:MAG: type II toxin-antitoxin system Phd/YefM family antitoxin [Pseudomonadota bacterium]
MRAINIHETKTHFSKLVDAAISGEEIIITKVGTPVARLIPISKNRSRYFGVLKGKLKIANDFDAPLPDNILSNFKES